MLPACQSAFGTDSSVMAETVKQIKDDICDDWARTLPVYTTKQYNDLPDYAQIAFEIAAEGYLARCE